MIRFKLAVALLLGSTVACAQNEKKLQADFLKPTLEYRMNVNRHSMPRDDREQDSMIQWIISNGYGGMATNVNPNEYLKSDEELKVFNRFVHASKARGLDLWLYDERSYPSGMADTYVLDEHPEWEAEGLLFKDTTVNGGTAVDLPLLPGQPILVKAVPSVDGQLEYDRARSLLSSIRDGRIRWTAPDGTWTIAQISHAPLYTGFQAGTDRGGTTPRYPSLLMPEVTKRFIELTHRRYAQAFTEKLGTLFTSTFTDEPSSMALPFPNLGYGVYPWKENVSTEFMTRYSADLKDVLLPMMLDRGPEGEKLRYRYFRIIADFMSRNYFRQIREYCSTQQLKSGGHLLVEETMMAQVPLYGSIMACYREMDVPGIDVLTGRPSFTRRYLYSSRLASSAAELQGNSMVMCESCPISDYNFYDGKEAPTIEIKGSLNRQIVGGVTDFNNYLQLQHEDSNGRKAFNDYIARVEMMLAGGVRASRIAVYYPVETLWSKYRPLPSCLQSWDNVAGGAPEAQRLSQLFDRVSDCLYDNGWEFSYVDAAGIEQSKVENKSLAHGELRWDVLILPGVETITPQMLTRITEFARAGGCVILLEALPKNTPDAFPSEAVESAVAQMVGDKTLTPAVYYEPTFNARLLNYLLEGVLDRDIVLDSYAGVLHSHKRIGGRNVYFIVNDTNAPKTVKANFPGAKSLEGWNPQTGEVKPLENGAPLPFGPYDGMIIRQTK